jgi:hypothetical protein
VTGGRRLSRPSGWRPPAEVVVNATGQRIELAPLAREVSRRYAREFPGEAEHYGEHWLAWCIHDNQHILAWAVYEHDGVTSLERQLVWLAGLLEARGHPVQRLARDLDIAADVAEEGIAAIGPQLARRLRAGADLLRSRDTSR